MITPTVGRVVWFHEGDDEPDAQPRAAIVSYVHSDTLVNLMVIESDGGSWGCTNVELCQGETRPGGSDYCEWMPYQKGQAVKTEALESQLKGAA